MQRVSIDDVEPYDAGPDLRVLTGPLGATDVAVNRYDAAPGDRIGGGYHTHHDQEELFYVESGTATFETADGDIEVRAGEIVRFGPGEFHHAYNAGEAPLVVLAFGAPPESEEVESVRECTACGEVFHHHRPSFMDRGIGPDDPAREIECPECGGETRRIGRPD